MLSTKQSVLPVVYRKERVRSCIAWNTNIQLMCVLLLFIGIYALICFLNLHMTTLTTTLWYKILDQYVFYVNNFDFRISHNSDTKAYSMLIFLLPCLLIYSGKQTSFL